jgi:flagellar biosynthesis protein FlhG
LIPDQAEKLRILTSDSVNETEVIPNAISVISGKGGTGKTFFSVNFAQEISETGKKVLLVDLDINFANVHLALNIEPKFTLFDYFTGRVLFEEIIFNYNSHLDLILGESGNFEYQPDESDIEKLIKKISKISQNYDFIIFDNSPGISDKIITTVRFSEFPLLVVNPEITSVLDSYVVLKAFKKKKIDKKSLILINKNVDEKSSNLTFENLSKATRKFLKVDPDFLGSIPYDASVQQAFSEMRMLREFAPQSQSLKEIKSIVGKFTKKNQLANIHQSMLKSI